MASNSPAAKLRRRLWHCPPVESPLPLSALLRAIARSLSGTDVRQDLRAYLKQRFAAEDVVLYSSGTHALTAAFNATLDTAAERIVALPAFACYDLATAAIGANARVLLYDLDPETLGPDWDSFDSALAAGAVVGVVAPLFGYPVDWDRVRAAARRYGAVAIEDAAQAAGASWKGRPLGSFGDMSVLSFGRGKGWTGAGGGALLLRTASRSEQPDAAGTLASIRGLVNACAQMTLAHPRLYGIPAALPWLHLGETRYKAPAPVTGISRLSAALASATAQPAVAARQARAERAERYHDALRSVPAATCVRPLSASAPGFLRCAVLLDSEELRSQLRAFARDGVTVSYPTPLRLLPALQPILLDPACSTPGADRLARMLVTFPTHRHARLDTPDRIAARLRRTAPPTATAAKK